MLTCLERFLTETIQTAQKLLRVICGFLRAVYGWFRIVARGFTLVTSHLWVIYGKINPLRTLVRRFLDLSKHLFSRILTSLRVVPSYLWIPASYLRMPAIDYELAICKDSVRKIHVSERGVIEHAWQKDYTSQLTADSRFSCVYPPLYGLLLIVCPSVLSKRLSSRPSLPRDATLSSTLSLVIMLCYERR